MEENKVGVVGHRTYLDRGLAGSQLWGEAVFQADSEVGKCQSKKTMALELVKMSLWMEKVKATGHIVIEIQRARSLTVTPSL